MCIYNNYDVYFETYSGTYSGLKLLGLCGSRKYPYPPPPPTMEDHWKFRRRERGIQDQNF